MFSRPPSRIVVADAEAAELFTIELLRNILIARPGANVLVVGVDGRPLLHSFLTHQALRWGARTDHGLGYWDVVVIGEGAVDDPTVDGDVRTAITLPGARATVAAERQLDLVVGTPTGDVVVVPGTARTIDGTHTLTAEAFGRLRRAEELARRMPVRAVILSGWNGNDERGASEAAQLLDAWRGPHIPVILDEAARTTAENALWSASLATALGDVRTVRMVASWVSSLRLGLATRSALRTTTVRPRLSIVWGRAHGASWRPAIGGLAHLRRHLRVGRALLADGPGSPEARL